MSAEQGAPPRSQGGAVNAQPSQSQPVDQPSHSSNSSITSSNCGAIDRGGNVAPPPRDVQLLRLAKRVTLEPCPLWGPGWPGGRRVMGLGKVALNLAGEVIDGQTVAAGAVFVRCGDYHATAGSAVTVTVLVVPAPLRGAAGALRWQSRRYWPAGHGLTAEQMVGEIVGRALQ